MDNEAKKLSNELDEALQQEEYHRDQLLFWKSRRLALERQLPRSKTWLDILDVLEEAAGNDYNRN